MGWWAARRERRELWLRSAQRHEAIAERIEHDPDACDEDLEISRRLRRDAWWIRWQRGFIIRG